MVSQRRKPDSELSALVERWCKSRSPRVADLIDRLGLQADDGFSASLKPITKTGPAAESSQRMASIAMLPDDPRLTTAILGWLAKPRWAGSSSAQGWEAMFARLVDLRDVRALAPLRAAAKELPPFQGLKHRAWMQERIAETADALAKATAPLKPAKDDDLLALEASLAPENAPPRPAPGSTVAPVFASPDDDDVRRVVADALLEHGDPWGELIQLQLLIAGGKATTEQEALAAELIKKHGKTFAGPIAAIAKAETRKFEKGFLVHVSTDASMVGRSGWEQAIGAPHWSTVRSVSIDFASTPKWWVSAWAKGADHKSVRQIVFALYRRPKIVCERADGGAPWRVTEVHAPAPPFLKQFGEWAKGLSNSERERIEVAAIPERDAVLATLEAL